MLALYSDLVAIFRLDQLANLHSDTLRDLAPHRGMERSNGIPMEIFRLYSGI